MNEHNIKIKKIQAKALFHFSDKYYNCANADDIIPIGRSRALALAKNPCADENDVGLLVAYLNNKCIGYIGIMPGWIRIKNKIKKIHWLSTWFVPREFRRTSVGLGLILEARSLNYDLVVSGMSKEAEKVYKALKFKQLGVLNYFTLKIYLFDPFNLALRMIRRIIRKIRVRAEIPCRLIKMSKPIYYLIYKFFFIIMINSQIRLLDNVIYKEVTEISESVTKRDGYPNSIEFYRNRDVINWMLKYRWTKTQEEAEKKDYNYFFSEIIDKFKFIAVELYSKKENRYKGFLVLSFSINGLDRTLKILDHHFSDPKDNTYIMALTFKYAKDNLANVIEIPEELYNHIPAKGLIRLIIHQKKRTYLISPKKSESRLANLNGNIKLKYCDGEMAFI